MDRHHLGADPYPDLTFQFAADPGPDPTATITYVEDKKVSTFIYNNASLYCSNFLISVIKCHKFQYFGQYIQLQYI